MRIKILNSGSKISNAYISRCINENGSWSHRLVLISDDVSHGSKFQIPQTHVASAWRKITSNKPALKLALDAIVQETPGCWPDEPGALALGSTAPFAFSHQHPLRSNIPRRYLIRL